MKGDNTTLNALNNCLLNSTGKTERTRSAEDAITNYKRMLLKQGTKLPVFLHKVDSKLKHCDQEYYQGIILTA